MWNYEKRLQYPINIKNCNPTLAAMIISQYGGPDGKISANLLKRKALMNSIVQMNSVIIAVMPGAVRMLLCLSKLKLI